MSSSVLYLDTARLGLMSPTAQRAHRDFARFAGEEGCPLYFEEFLRNGAAGRPDVFSNRFAGLACWPGIAGLKQRLRHLTDTPQDWPVLIANRSAQLMKLAARLLFLPCENVLVTDLGWPAYRRILDSEQSRAGRRITEVQLRDAILRDQACECEVINRICTAFIESNCDGLFLTEVSHDGVRLPVERIVPQIERHRELRLVVVDGAQALAHTTTNLGAAVCDLYLAGCHKWLQAYQPMGLAFYGSCRSRSVIDTVCNEMLRTGDLDDPLLRFAQQIEADDLDGNTETVNLSSLFACAGALCDVERERSDQRATFSLQLQNAHRLVELTTSTDWSPRAATEPFQSGIVLIQSKREATRQARPCDVRAAFVRRGLAVTAYEDGVVRMSMPKHPLGIDDIDHIYGALKTL